MTGEQFCLVYVARAKWVMTILAVSRVWVGLAENPI